MEGIFNAVVNAVGLEPAVLAGLLALAMFVFNAIGRAIPDTATGVLGLVRKVAKVLGLYVSNRIDSQNTTTSVSSKVANGRM